MRRSTIPTPTPGAVRSPWKLCPARPRARVGNSLADTNASASRLHHQPSLRRLSDFLPRRSPASPRRPICRSRSSPASRRCSRSTIHWPNRSRPAFIPAGAGPAEQLQRRNGQPFGFNGQLETDVGYGSGVAVQTNVVLDSGAPGLQRSDFVLCQPGLLVCPAGNGRVGAFSAPGRSWYVSERLRRAKKQRCDVPGTGPIQSAIAELRRGGALFSVTRGGGRLWRLSSFG